ncbi:Fcf2-domain-containing protein, partial [Sporormia fimetaria CBS 119925]
MALSLSQNVFDDDMDEELSDAQIQSLLDEAERNLRAKQQTRETESLIRLPKLNPGHIADTSLRTEGSITRVDPSKLVRSEHRVLAEGIKKIEDPIQLKKQKLVEKQETAGANWFNMPKTDLTPELRRDLQLLKMRSVLDPKRHYKKMDSKSDVPAFSQVGTIIEGPTEYYTSRINNKDRKRTFVEEVLAQEAQTGRFKNKSQDVRQAKASGKKNFYKALKAKRNGRVEK